MARDIANNKKTNKYRALRVELRRRYAQHQVTQINFIMGIPGADDIMLNYQSTSFHDALYLRSVLGLKRAPEFDAWLARMAITEPSGRLREIGRGHHLLKQLPHISGAA